MIGAVARPRGERAGIGPEIAAGLFVIVNEALEIRRRPRGDLELAATAGGDLGQLLAGDPRAGRRHRVHLVRIDPADTRRAEPPGAFGLADQARQARVLIVDDIARADAEALADRLHPIARAFGILAGELL